MTEDYYLINNEIKFYFDIEKQCIEFKDKTESLEPKEAQILKYILEHHEDGIIKSETILDNNWEYWNDKKVLQKVLSTLRKKFKSIDVAENGFIAAGSSYKINYIGNLVNSHTEQIKEKTAQRNKVMSSVKTAVIWAFIGAISLFAIIKINEIPGFTVDNIIQATAISGVSLQPALSPDGSVLAFSHKKEGSSQIYLKRDSNLNFQMLTSNHFDQVPSWSPSGRQIAFQRYENDICEIRLIQLNDDYNKVGSDSKIADCHDNNSASSIAWETETSLFFTDPNKPDGPNHIKRLDLTTKTTTTYLSYPDDDSSYAGSGHYYLTYYQADKALYSLESPNWVVTNITKANPNNTVNHIHQVNDILRSFDIYNHQIIFKDLDNQLKSFPLDNPDELITVYKNPLKPIFYPTISADNNKIAIISGSVYRNSLYAMSLKTDEISEIMTSLFNLRDPQAVGNEIFYASKKTGIYQIYSFINNTRTQLTNYTEHKQIVYFTVSSNKAWMAINFIDSTVLYKRHKNGLTRVKTFPLMSYPAFSLDNERILLTNLLKTDNNSDNTLGSNSSHHWKKELIEFSLSNFLETGITVKNALFGVYHQTGIIHISADTGIKLFTLNGVQTIVDFPGPDDPNLFGANKDNIFISGRTSVQRINLKTKQSTELPQQVNGAITVNDDYIFFRSKTYGSMDIFKGDLIEN
ncbi:MAG: Tol biopolymer transport system component/DNA-binding winged helix-turn-helix (wHTH) protein [Phenylobacterium sp.]|jgi:Tol biopolymer transport system component/DNA-binding winged helix-turn-helix (wHTH) protein